MPRSFLIKKHEKGPKRSAGEGSPPREGEGQARPVATEPLITAVAPYTPILPSLPPLAVTLYNGYIHDMFSALPFYDPLRLHYPHHPLRVPPTDLHKGVALPTEFSRGMMTSPEAIPRSRTSPSEFHKSMISPTEPIKRSTSPKDCYDSYKGIMSPLDFHRGQESPADYSRSMVSPTDFQRSRASPIDMVMRPAPHPLEEPLSVVSSIEGPPSPTQSDECPQSPDSVKSMASSNGSRKSHGFQDGVTVAYTYDAFFVSDGRSRRRNPMGIPEQPVCRQKYTCSECGKQYATSSNLSRHKQTHRSLDSKQAKQCPHCHKVYVSMPALSMHILTHSLRHECTVCGKSFSRPWLLQGHIRSHSGEKPYGCAHCGKAFADRSNLRAHMQTHSAFKHYSCKRCNKSFALKSYLNKHYESSCFKDDMSMSMDHSPESLDSRIPDDSHTLRLPDHCSEQVMAC